MDIALVAGRSFSEADSRSSEAVGKHIKWVSEARWRRIIGVVADVRQYNLSNRPPAGISGAIYMPYSQSIDEDGRMPHVMNLIVKTANYAPQTPDELHRFAVSVNPNIPVSKVAALDGTIGESYRASARQRGCS
jgi:hypothetical protein